MLYRDLLADRAGGALIASHIRIPHGGAVPDYVQDVAGQGRRRLYGRILRGLDALAATRVHAAMATERQEVLLAAGGSGVGTFWTTVPAEPQHGLVIRERRGPVGDRDQGDPERAAPLDRFGPEFGPPREARAQPQHGGHAPPPERAV